MFYNSPYYTAAENLEVAITSINFNEEVIKNLRKQIENLRVSLSNYESIEVIETNQYKHIRKFRLDLPA